MTNLIKTAALAAAASLGIAAGAAPASAATGFDPLIEDAAPSAASDSAEYSRDRHYRNGRYPAYSNARRYSDRPVYNNNNRVWRGRDGRYYCKRSNGTTGMLIGGAAGALLGRELDGGYNRATGTILGAAGGALLGREIDRGGSRCR